MAVESGEVVVTTNGGTSWTTENAPAGIGQINAISCPSATTCTVVGYGAPSNLPVIAATTNGGMSWTNQTPPGPAGAHRDLVSLQFDLQCCGRMEWCCRAFRRKCRVVTTTNGGADWTSENIPADSEELDGISCPSTTTCVAVGAVPYHRAIALRSRLVPSKPGVLMSTTDGGTTWSGESGNSPGFDEGDSFSGVSCPSTSECMAVGGTDGIWRGKGHRRGHSSQRNLHTRDGLWKSQLSLNEHSHKRFVLLSVRLHGRGCSLNRVWRADCDHGATGWTTQNAPLGAVAGVTCPSASECMVSGGVAEDGQPGAVAETTNGGANWTAVFTLPYAVSSLFAVSCPSPSVCTAVGGSTGPGESSGDFGPGEGPGVVLKSTDGGTGWTPQTLPTGTGPLSAVSCASTSVCEALGSDPYVGAPFIVGTTDGGANWQSQTAPSGNQTLTQLSCPSTSDCTGIGETTGGPVIFGTTDGGAKWTNQTVPSGLSNLTSIACPSVTVCTAVGWTNASAPTPNAAIVATTNGGATWTTETAPSGVSNLASIACPTVSACMAIGHVATPMSAGPLTIISTSNGGATWTNRSFPSSQVTFANDIACASATACTVVGEATAGSGPGLALATTDGGSTWTTESTPPANDYVGISCPAIGACTAVGVQTGASAAGGAIIIGQAPTLQPELLIPSNGTTLTGSTLLDASATNATSVEFGLFGGSYVLNAPVLCTATPTYYGWLCNWNTTTVPNGTYFLASEAFGAGGNALSSGVSITVRNLPTTSVLFPSTGATLVRIDPP